MGDRAECAPRYPVSVASREPGVHSTERIFQPFPPARLNKIGRRRRFIPALELDFFFGNAKVLMGSS